MEKSDIVLSVTWSRSVSRLVQSQFVTRDQVQVPLMELVWFKQLALGFERCCHAGDALLSFALRWPRARKPPSAPDSFTAHHAPSSVFTSPNSRHPPQRCGREVTGPLKPRSRRHGIVSKARQPKPHKPPVGRRNNPLADLGAHNHQVRFATPRTDIVRTKEIVSRD